MEQNMQNTALLIMDMQAAFLPGLGGSETLIDNNAKAIKAARDKGIPVIYVVVGFRDGMPEINMNNKSFAASKQRLAGVKMEDMVKIEPSLAPQGDEVTVTKKRYSAFAGSDLEVILRSKGIQHIVLTGVVTSGVVLSTLREAADKDYRITVLSDCCADRDEEVHRVLTTKVFPTQADVMTVEEWISL